MQWHKIIYKQRGVIYRRRVASYRQALFISEFHLADRTTTNLLVYREEDNKYCYGWKRNHKGDTTEYCKKQLHNLTQESQLC